GTAFANRGSLRGNVQFPARPLVVGDARGVLDWFKPVRPHDKFFPNGLDLQRSATLARYRRPAAGTRLLAFAASAYNGRIVLDEGGFPAIDQLFTLKPNTTAAATPPNNSRLNLHFDLPTGLFHGTFKPDGHHATPFAGAIFQADETG